jgi:hypothetical protein
MSYSVSCCFGYLFHCYLCWNVQDALRIPMIKCNALPAVYGDIINCYCTSELLKLQQASAAPFCGQVWLVLVNNSSSFLFFLMA